MRRLPAWKGPNLFSRQRRRPASECSAYPAVANISIRITAGQSAPVSGYVTLCLPPDGAASSMVSHLILESRLEIKIEKRSLSWSPVTESNRRPSPYHAYRFRLMTSGWVGLPQVGAILVSEYVALGLSPFPGAVVTWFVTGFRISPLPLGCGDPRADESLVEHASRGVILSSGRAVGADGDALSLSVVRMCLPSQSVAFGSGCPPTRSCWLIGLARPTGMRSLSALGAAQPTSAVLPWTSGQNRWPRRVLRQACGWGCRVAAARSPCTGRRRRPGLRGVGRGGRGGRPGFPRHWATGR